MIKILLQFIFILLLAACTTTTSNATTSPTSNATPSLTSSTPEVPATSTPTQETVDMTKIRYLALGDSYTIGEKVASRNRWPIQLSELLRNEGIDPDVTIIARTGWTVQELWEGIQANPPEGMYDMVSLLIGVNDQYRGYPVDGYREDFRFMLNKAIEYAGGDPKRVGVLSIPDWGFTPFAAVQDTEPISLQIDEFNAINLEETQNAGAYYVDVTIISRMGLDDFELITGDRLHPSGKMYAMWAEKTLPIALEILSEQKGD
ncbi:MAG TPA: SGNH/GDSL hydrolase family protein [Anaerolineales bacterium]|nr:SGNH/GDSL hydrolase family protein [Anaerolineales bacterium]